MNRSNRSARIKLDLAERRLVVGHVLLQERHQRFGLLRAKINSLEVSQFHLRLCALLHGPKNQEEVPNIDSYLYAVRVSFAVIGCLHEFYIWLIRRIHTSKCNAWGERWAKANAAQAETGDDISRGRPVQFSY